MRRAALILVAAAVLSLGGTGSAGSVSVSCPRGMLPLDDDALVQSIRAALNAEPRRSDAFATSAVIALYDELRGRARQVRHRCGRRGFQRTVIVYFLRRAYLPAQSASQGVSFVARFRSGYRVWERAH